MVEQDDLTAPKNSSRGILNILSQRLKDVRELGKRSLKAFDALISPIQEPVTKTELPDKKILSIIEKEKHAVETAIHLTRAKKTQLEQRLHIISSQITALENKLYRNEDDEKSALIERHELGSILRGVLNSFVSIGNNESPLSLSIKADVKKFLDNPTDATLSALTKSMANNPDYVDDKKLVNLLTDVSELYPEVTLKPDSPKATTHDKHKNIHPKRHTNRLFSSITTAKESASQFTTKFKEMKKSRAKADQDKDIIESTEKSSPKV